MPEVRIEEGEHGPAITNGLITVRVHLNKGTYDVLDTEGRAVITDAAVSVAIKDGPTFTTRGAGVAQTDAAAVTDPQGTGLSLVLERETDESEPLLSTTITLYPDHPFAVICPLVENTGPAPLGVHALNPLDRGRLDLGADPKSLRFYKHGWQSWSPTLVLDCSGEDVAAGPPVTGPGTQPQQMPGRFSSDLITTIVDPATNRGVLAGYISAFDQFSAVWLDTDPGLPAGKAGELSASAYADGIEVPPAKWLAAERFIIDTTEPLYALERFGDALGREMSALPVDEVASGWCSWYYYFTGVSEDEVIANLDDLAAHRETIPVGVFQIDDGYQSEIGDWLTVNEKFPHGMKWCADQIHGRGYQAGLWVAPFLAGAKSRVFKEHPDWFVKYSTASPAIATVNWGQPCFALDLTHPGVQDYVSTVFRTVFDDWGYDYVKIDFIYAAAVDGVRHDPNVTRAQAYRKGLELVREAAGDRFILACGNPMGPSVGLVDAARIGPDVAPFWYPMAQGAARSVHSDPSALNSVRNTISRYWMHNRLWANDPDCLLVRSTETQMSGDEVRALTTVIGLTGGMMLHSDKLTELTPDRRDYISLCLPVHGQSARPLDLFQTPETARLLRLDLETHTLLAVFNWDDASAETTIPLPAGDWHVFELWEEEYLGLRTGDITLPVPPHGCRLLRLTQPADLPAGQAGHPQVIGTNLHILMGALEIGDETWDGEKLHVTLKPVAKKDGALWVVREGEIERVEVSGMVEEQELSI
jgi:alpha-galactosidase